MQSPPSPFIRTRPPTPRIDRNLVASNAHQLRSNQSNELPIIEPHPKGMDAEFSNELGNEMAVLHEKFMQHLTLSNFEDQGIKVADKKKATQYAQKQWVKWLEAYLSNEKQRLSEAIKNTREFPPLWMQRDAKIAKMMRRLKHFGPILFYLWTITKDRARCIELSQGEEIHAAFQSGRNFLNDMSNALGISIWTIENYIRELQKTGIVIRLGKSYHNPIFSIGLWICHKDRDGRQGWNRRAHVKNTPEWRNILQNFTITT